MPEVEAQVKTFVTKYICDNKGCGGTMEAGDLVLTGWPPTWPHKCNVCGAVKSFGEKFPRVTYRMEEPE